MLFNREANAEWCDFIAGKIRSIVKDPATAERLIPKDQRFGEKRPPFVTGYYEAFNRPNVSLVDLRETPIVRVTPTGIETTDGHASSTSSCGRPGSTSAPAPWPAWGSGAGTAWRWSDYWADGPRTFLGVQTHGFPNLFFPGGPHAAAGNNPRYNGDQVDFITDLLRVRPRARLRGHRGDQAGRGALDQHGQPWRRLTHRSARAATTSAPTSPASRCGTCSTPGAARSCSPIIADVVANDYDSFILSSRPGPSRGAPARRAEEVASVTRSRSASPASPPRRASAGAGR